MCSCVVGVLRIGSSRSRACVDSGVELSEALIWYGYFPSEHDSVGRPHRTETEHAACVRPPATARPFAASRCDAAALGAAEEARPRRGARGEVGARERAAGDDDDGAGRHRAGHALAERAEPEPSSSAAGGDGSAAS